jgi:hypothetical protein
VGFHEVYYEEVGLFQLYFFFLIIAVAPLSKGGAGLCIWGMCLAMFMVMYLAAASMGFWLLPAL